MKDAVPVKFPSLHQRLALTSTCIFLIFGYAGRALSSTAAIAPTIIFTAPAGEFGYISVPIPDLPPLADSVPYLPEPAPKASRLVLRLGERRVYVYSNDKIVASYPVAVGRLDTPTPTGRFAVFQMIENPVWQSPWTGEVRSPGANSALGLRWIGFARMPGGIIGFHGTPTVASIGQAASHGCVRLRNEDVLALFEQVQIGTPVEVEP
jgi:hypothetical protein